MTGLTKITKEQLVDYVAEVGEFEKEHRKYSSFYCWSTHLITEQDVKVLAEEGVDASDFLGVLVTLNGMWDDSYGTEWDDPEFSKMEEYEELVPEQIIPAHTVKKQRTEKFDYKWGQ